MLAFKLNLYYEKYKDTSIISRKYFKNQFIKENGNFPLLNELLLMIEKYQIKKYGSLLVSGTYIPPKESKEILHNRESNRYTYRFGSKEDVKGRKIREGRK